MPGLAVQQDAEGVRFAVKVAPRAGCDAIRGVHDGALKLSLTAAPVDGAANRALCALLAKRLGVAKGRVRVVAGERSKHKVIAVRGIDAEALKALCEAT